MTPVAVTVLTGFLGAGKTTLLRQLLQTQQEEKIAVIENEFSEMPIDNQLIGSRATRITTLSNGCICCTRSGEMEAALLDLLDCVDRGEVQFDRLVIECTGMADPGPILQAFFAHEIICKRYVLDGVITLVDAVHAMSQLDQFPLAQSQIGYADRIVLTKTDIAGQNPELMERLARINARAPVMTMVQGDIDSTWLFNVRGFMLQEEVIAAKPRFHHITQQHNAVSSIVVEFEYPVELAAVSAVMQELLASFADNLMRYKGMLWITDKPCRLLFQGVQRLYSADWDRPWQPDETPRSAIVFIGMHLPETEIRDAFARLQQA